MGNGGLLPFAPNALLRPELTGIHCDVEQGNMVAPNTTKQLEI
jgi:hypothetical protein